jgi:hypothetical protein
LFEWPGASTVLLQQSIWTTRSRCRAVTARQARSRSSLTSEAAANNQGERRLFFMSVDDAAWHPSINECDQDDGQSERANYAHHHLVAVGPVQFCCSSTGAYETTERFKRAVLVLRILRRPIIAPVLRPNPTPITPCGLPVALSSSSRSSSSGVHFLLLFLGMTR